MQDYSCLTKVTMIYRWDEESITGGYHGYQYTCILSNGAEISCNRDEFEFID